MQTTIADLTKIFILIKDKFLNQVDSLNLPCDYYWTLASDAREKTTTIPDLIIGSLVDDWLELKKIPGRELASFVDIDRFASILIAFGQHISQKEIFPENNEYENLMKNNLPTKININTLIKIYPYIESAILLLNPNEIYLSNDLYWTIDPEQREKILENPTPRIGSLCEDWRKLENALQSKVVTTQDIYRFANILIAVAEVSLH